MILHVINSPAPFARVWERSYAWLYRVRGALLSALLGASLLALAASLWHWHRLSQDNAAIAALQAGADPMARGGEAGEVKLARVNALLMRDRFDDAQAAIDAARPIATPEVMARMLYNQANANVRRAFAAIEAAKPDAAIPLTRLAKDAYREALRLQPMAWDAKHNYDVATRLLRDFPGHEQDGEEVPPEAEVKLWTDLPGVPQGGP
jgi:mxaK protein